MIFLAAQQLDSAFLSVLIYLGYVLPAGFSKFQIFGLRKCSKNDFRVFLEKSSFWKNKKKLRHESKLQIKQEKVFSKQFLKPLEHLDR